MDGVLADFEGWAATMFGEFPKWKQEIEKPNWGEFSKHPNLFELLPVMSGAKALYEGCVDMIGDKNQVQILTALPNRAAHVMPDAAQHKIGWARRYISPDIRVHFGPYAQHKQYHKQHPNDILIDDMALNIEQWKKVGGIGILHIDAVTSLREVANELSQIR